MKTGKPLKTAFSLMALATLVLSGCTRKEPATSAKPYPLSTCVVSGEKLGSMGDPVVFVHDGQEIKLCCKSCRPDFDKEPAKYLTKIKDAETK